MENIGFINYYFSKQIIQNHNIIYVKHFTYLFNGLLKFNEPYISP